MKRTTIFIPEALEADLQQHARRARKPVAWVVREAVASYLSANAAPRGLPASVAMGDSGASDLSERLEDLVFADLAGDAGRATKPRPRPSRARHAKRRP